MLDKSVPYKSIVMRLDDNAYTGEEHAPPAGFSFKLFVPSDARHWARIEASVKEFNSEKSAETFFNKAFMPYEDDLVKRCVFAVNPEGLPVATASAWYAESELDRQACLHWVAVCPEYQGMGLGRAVTVKALSLLRLYEPGMPVWLHTQTWSHIAVRLYHSLGFNVSSNGQLANMNTVSGETEIYDNESAEAIKIIEKSLDAGFADELRRTAV